jgi:hypothetical protein
MSPGAISIGAPKKKKIFAKNNLKIKVHQIRSALLMVQGALVQEQFI